MKQKLIISIIFISTFWTVTAQQLPITNQYLINKFALSPAYAGINNNIETFMSFRQSWAGISGAPTLQNIDVNMPYKKQKMGFGLTINNEQTGNFKHFYTDLSYAYRIQIGRSDSYISFGMAAKLYRNQIDLSSVITQGVDPLIAQSNTLVGTSFDASAGVLFNTKELYVGLSAPRIIGLQAKYKGSEGAYTQARHLQAHASYVIEPNKTFYIEPIVVVRTTFNSPIQFDVVTFMKIKQRLWTALSYRHGSGIGLSVGGALSDGIVLNYSYEAGIMGVSSMSSGTHEISMGFLIKRSERRKMPTIFPETDDEKNNKLQQEMERKLATVEKKLKSEVKKREQKIRELEAKLNEMQKNFSDMSAENQLKQDQLDMSAYDKPFVLENIKFGNNSDKLFASSNPELDKLWTKMRRAPEAEIIIIGYTDNKGSVKYNQRLSEKRAIAVYKYLTGKGVAKKRIVYKGLGDKNPRASNATTEGRAQNRRIEVAFKK